MIWLRKLLHCDWLGAGQFIVNSQYFKFGCHYHSFVHVTDLAVCFIVLDFSRRCHVIQINKWCEDFMFFAPLSSGVPLVHTFQGDVRQGFIWGVGFAGVKMINGPYYSHRILTQIYNKNIWNEIKIEHLFCAKLCCTVVLDMRVKQRLGRCEMIVKIET